MAFMVQTSDVETFKKAMASFAAGVTVITVADESGRPTGMTATAFSSVSVDPMLVLICVNRSNRTYERIVEKQRFGVNILSVVDEEIAKYCATPGADKVLKDEWLREDLPAVVAPALKTAHAFVDCIVDTQHDASTHAIFIGRVQNVGVTDESEPLVYHRGQFCCF